MRSSGAISKRESFTERRTKRYSIPPEVKIPGLDISELSTEMLELLVSGNPKDTFYKSWRHSKDTPLIKTWKRRAAHKLATRYIIGEQAACDHVKAHAYAEMEINCMSIEELENKFFQIDTETGDSINIVDAWLAKIEEWRTKAIPMPPVRNKVLESQQLLPPFHNKKFIIEFIEEEATKWNNHLNAEKKASAHAILFAWEKQLAAKRLKEHYKAQDKLTSTVKSKTATVFYKQILRYLKEHEPPSTMPQWLVTIFCWFNAIRLAIVRLNKSLTQFNAPFLATPFLKWVASIAGLYFLCELILDCGVLIKAALFNAKGEFKPSFTRLRNTFWEDNRPSRMLNALVWFGINFTCLMLTIFLAPAAPLVAAFWCGALTVAGCIFDVGAEAAIGLYANSNIKKSLEMIDAQLTELDKIRDKTKAEAKIKPEQHPFLQRPKDTIPAIVQQRTALLIMQEQLQNKRKALVINRAYTIAIMMLLLICAGFIFFPPAALPLAPIIAGCIALIGGSVFGGLGKRLFWNAPEYCKNIKDFVLDTCTSIKHYFSPKVKPTPIYAGSHTCPDDHTYTSALLKKELAIVGDHPSSLAFTLNEKDEIKTIKKKFSGSNLHRSPSGDLFSCAPVSTAMVTPEIKTHKNPLSL